MKRLYAAILAASMAAGIAFPASALENDEITGKWYGNMLGIQMELNFNDDESYSIDVMGDSDEGTWTIKDDLLICDPGTDEEIVFEYDPEEGTLVPAESNMSGMDVTFSREAVPDFEPAEIKDDAKEEDFSGSWKAVYCSFLGVTLKAEIVDLNMMVTFDDEMVTLNSDQMELNNVSFNGAYSDGAYKAKTDETTITANLLEDDSIMLKMSTDGEDFTFYLERDDEDTEVHFEDTQEDITIEND